MPELRSQETKAEVIRTNALYVVNLWGVEKLMDKENAETRKKLKGISSVDEFRRILERTMLSERNHWHTLQMN